MRLAKLLFAPRSIDAFAIVTCLLAFLCGVYLFSIYQRPDYVPEFLMYFSLGSVAFATGGIAVAGGWNRHSWRRAISLSLICVLLLLAPIVLPHFFPSVPTNEVEPKNAVTFDDRNISTTSLLALGFIPVLAIVLSLVVIVLRKSPVTWKRLKQNYKLTRTRILIAVAGTLAVFSIAKNLFGLAGFKWGEEFWVNNFEMIFVVGSGSVTFLLAVHWPGWALTVSRRWWPVIVVWLAVFATIGVAAWVIVSNIRWMNEDELLFGLAPVAGVFLFLLSLVAMRSDERRLGETANQPAPIKSTLPGFRWWPSIWSAIPFTLLLASAAVPWCFDLPLLGQSSGGLVQMNWPLAWESARLRRLSGGQIRIESNWRQIELVAELNDRAPDNILAMVDTANFNAIKLSGLTPTIDTSKLRGWSGSATLSDSQISRTQLADICSQAYLIAFANVDIAISGSPVESGNVNLFSFARCQPGQMSHIISSFNSLKSVQTLSVQTLSVSSDLGMEDWQAILDASQECDVYLIGKVHESVLATRPENSCRRIALQVTEEAYGTDFRPLIAAPLIRESDIRVSFHGDFFSSADVYWDVHFLLDGSSCFGSHDYNDPDKSITFDEASRKFHWAFEFNGQDQITGLYLPNGEMTKRVSELSSLKILSFDDGWLTGNLRASPGTWTATSHLADLTQLERLDFSQDSEPGDLSFLASLNNLKHLQIRALDRTVTGPAGFDSCPGLKTVVLFGKPDTLTVTELDRLPSLDSLTIVSMNEDAELTDPAYLADLRSRLKKSELKIIAAKDFALDLPQSFQDHVKRTREKLAEKYWGEGN